MIVERLIRASLAMTVTFAVCAPAAAANAEPPTPPPIQGAGYHLVKNWDFAKGIRTEAAMRQEFFTRYIYGKGTLDHLNDEWERYADDHNHVFEPDGLDLIAWSKGLPSPGTVKSGMLRSKWSGEYGYFEAMVKVPREIGMWPAFWLNPQDQKWPPEIDIFEIVNNGRDTTLNSFHFLHESGIDAESVHSSNLDGSHRYTPGFDYASGFHCFAVEWLPHEIRHYVDNVLVADRDFQWHHNDGTDAGPAHLLVNLSVGGHWPGPPDTTKDLLAKLDISYIRVWQK